MGFTGHNPPAEGDVIPDRYIVVLKPFLSAQEVESHCSEIQSLHDQQSRVYADSLPAGGSFNTFSIGSTSASESKPADSSETFRGYSGVFLPETLQRIQNSSEVAYVEPDRYIRPQTQVTQPNPPSWGLSRISHRGSWNSANNQYIYDSDESGLGVTAYVIDTGVKVDHVDFGGRARLGVNLIEASQNTDTYGHGTHVAGIIGGTTYGVAKRVSIVDVKVYPDVPPGQRPSTAMSMFIQALQWVVGDAIMNGNVYKSVVNISSGGPKTIALNQAIAAAVRVGLIVVVAAGNEGIVANTRSPASAPEAITVGAIDNTDAMAPWSNWGQILDFFAPGVDIISCGISSNTAAVVMNGTSMASPHIAGLACCLRQNMKFSSPAALAQELRQRAEGACKLYLGHEPGTANIVSVNTLA